MNGSSRQNSMLFAAFFVVVTGLQGAPVSAQKALPAGAIRIEAERAVHSTFVIDTIDPAFVYQRDTVSGAREFAPLSGSRMSLLCTRARPDSAYVAVYEFTVTKPLASHLWVFEQGRAWSSPFEWRIGDGAWISATTALPTESWTKLADDGPTFAWTRLGAVALAPGKNRLEIRVTRPRDNGVYLLAQDCFVFTVPKGEDEGRPFEYRYEGPGMRSILLWDSLAPFSSQESGFLPWIDPYLVETTKPRGAVVIFPGGAYVGRAPSEAGNVARRFNKEGYHAFVVYYRTSPHRHPAPLMDAARAVRIVRSRAREWKVDSVKIAVCGFSAGGHLAASLGVHFPIASPGHASALDSISARPDALILCYPVISFGDYGHKGSMRNLLGPSPDSGLVQLLSLERHVTDRTPPAFLWHTAPDEVKVENSLAFATALSAKRIPFEIHVYHRGPHGLNIAENDTHVGSWVRLCSEWLAEMGWK